jgi:flavorubredoxin
MKMKILIGIVITILAFIVLSQLSRWCFSTSLNTQTGSKAEVLSSSRQSPKKALIIYQPGISDISSRIAHQIARGLNDGGYMVTLNYPGDHLSADVSKYSLLIFGSPVYSGQPSKALTDYMSKIKATSSGRIALYSTGGFKFYMELDTMEKSLNGMKAYKKIKFFTSAKKENDIVAYGLGKELSKE